MELNVTILCKDSLTYGRHRLLHSKTGYSYTTRGLRYHLQDRALASISTTAKQDKEIKNILMEVSQNSLYFL